jgi:hypothetical protein
MSQSGRVEGNEHSSGLDTNCPSSNIRTKTGHARSKQKGAEVDGLKMRGKW